jgi:hypothetical protein
MPHQGHKRQGAILACDSLAVLPGVSGYATGLKKLFAYGLKTMGLFQLDHRTEMTIEKSVSIIITVVLAAPARSSHHALELVNSSTGNTSFNTSENRGIIWTPPHKKCNTTSIF